MWFLSCKDAFVLTGCFLSDANSRHLVWSPVENLQLTPKKAKGFVLGSEAKWPLRVHLLLKPQLSPLDSVHPQFKLSCICLAYFGLIIFFFSASIPFIFYNIYHFLNNISFYPFLFSTHSNLLIYFCLESIKIVIRSQSSSWEKPLGNNKHK